MWCLPINVVFAILYFSPSCCIYVNCSCLFSPIIFFNYHNFSQHGYSFYSMSSNPVLSLLTLLLKLFQLRWLRAPPDWFLCPLDMCSSFFWLFSFWYYRMLQGHLIFFPGPILESVTSPGSPSSSYLDNGI